jgi:DNA-binding response OmpR family regulator/predicted CoA-binding protein
MEEYRVLIVDDQRDIRFLLRSGLETMLGKKVQVIDVPSGEEAILLITRQPIDLLIADVRLPGISGLELVERASVRNPGVRLIMMTGLDEPKTRRLVENAGADAVFYKPFDMSKFMQAVRACLGLDLPADEAGAAGSPGGPPSMTLAERLSSLRQELQASAVLLLNDDAEILSQTGKTAQLGDDPTMLSALASALNAAMKVNYLLGAQAKDLLYFEGPQYDLFLSHVSPEIGLLVWLQNGAWKESQMEKLADAMRAAVVDISAILEYMGAAAPAIEVTEVAPPTPQEEEVDISQVLPELETIFGKASKKAIKAEDVDSFWEQLSNASEDEITRSDAISYDQARQLGLAPEE